MKEFFIRAKSFLILCFMTAFIMIIFGCISHKPITASNDSASKIIPQNEKTSSSGQTSLPDTITKKDVESFKKEHPQFRILDEVYVSKDGLLNAAITYFDQSINSSEKSNVHMVLFTRHGVGNLTIGDKNYTFSNDQNGKITIIDDVTVKIVVYDGTHKKVLDYFTTVKYDAKEKNTTFVNTTKEK
jgi:hypothetical protein